jgi:hypothetical protein
MLTTQNIGAVDSNPDSMTLWIRIRIQVVRKKEKNVLLKKFSFYTER